MLDFATCTECGRCQDAVPGVEHRQAAVAQAADHGPARPPVRQGRGSTTRRGRRRPLVGTAGAGRRHRPGRALVVHHLRRLRRAVPGRHRARRPHRRHAPLPGADRVVVPVRGRDDAEEPGEQGQPVGHERPGPPGVDPGPGLRGAGPRRGRRGPQRGRLPLLGRLRRRARGPRQEDHPRLRRAAAHRRGEVRGARRGRGLHRRPGPPARQRVRVPDARPAERRDAQRGRRGQDRHRRDLPALLQLARPRVPAARRQLRGRPPHPAAGPAGRRRAGSPRSPRSTSW